MQIKASMGDVHVSLSKRKKNDRSVLLSSLMKGFSGETGDRAAAAFVKKDKAAFDREWSKVYTQISKEFDK